MTRTDGAAPGVPRRIVFLPSSVLLVPGASGRTPVLAGLRDALLAARPGGTGADGAGPDDPGRGTACAALTTGDDDLAVPDARAWVGPLLAAHGVPAAFVDPGSRAARTPAACPPGPWPADGVAAAGWLGDRCAAGPVPALQLGRERSGDAAGVVRDWLTTIDPRPEVLLVAGDGPATLADSSPLRHDPAAAGWAGRAHDLFSTGDAPGLAAYRPPARVRADGAVAWRAVGRIVADRLAGGRPDVLVARSDDRLGVDHLAAVWDLP